MTVFIDVSGEEYLALTDLSYSHKVNGEKSLKGTIYTNDEVINKIDRGWSLKYKDEIYYITYALPVDNGESVTVEFDAIHEFFYKMGKSSVYTTLDGSNTAIAYLDLIFTNSGYTYSLETTISAFDKQNFGMKNRLALFNDFINSTNTEFKVIGKTVKVVEKIGSDLSTIVRKGFNLQELGLEHNIGDFVTYAKGFGAYKDPDDETKGRLEVEYRSPLADVYGVLEADPVVDERYTIAENLTTKLKDLVESSYSISVSLTIEDLQAAGYEYGFPDPGDYIMAINEDLDFQQKIRIVSIDESIDVLGNSLDKTVTCSSLNLVDQKNQADANNSQTWNDISNGVKPIPSDWLTDAIQTATSDLLNARTELKFTSNGILAIDKSDSNRIVIMNSSGLGVSTDGGKTFGDAITAEGINASAITTGILRAINIEGVTIKGSSITSESGGNKTTLSNGTVTTEYNNKRWMALNGNSLSFYKADGTNVLGGIYRTLEKKTGREFINLTAQPKTSIYLGRYDESTQAHIGSIEVSGDDGDITFLRPSKLNFDLDVNNKGIKNVYLFEKVVVSNNTSLNFYSNLNMNGFNILNQSDIRLKENIEPAEIDGIAETKKLEFYEFDRKQNYQSKDERIQPNSERELGMIAQYTPFLTEKSEKDHYLRLNMSKQIMLNSLTNKQLIERIEKLEERIFQLEKIMRGGDVE